MTTTIAPDSPVAVTPRATPPGLKVTQARVIKSEWIKLRSLRSTLIALGVSVVVVIGLGLLFAAFKSGQISGPNNGQGGGGPARGATDPTGISLSGVTLAQLIVGSLGVMIAAGEYSTGMIRSSLAAVPKRLPVLWAKILVFAAVTFVLMLVASLLAFLGGQAVLSSGSAASASLGDPGVLRAVLGSAVQLAGVGVLGLALGALLRNTAGSVATLFGLTLLLPGLMGLFPDSFANAVSPYLPSNAIGSFVSVTPDSGMLAPGAGLAVFVAYLVVIIGAAAYFLKRRDA
jgi:ABC-type transport system involved in multi-copper enzyme maturation permease subunit